MSSLSGHHRIEFSDGFVEVFGDSGWDQMRNTVDATEEWWKDYIERHPLAAAFKKKGLEHEDLLHKLFAGTIETGDNVVNPSSQFSQDTINLTQPSPPLVHLESEERIGIEDYSTPTLNHTSFVQNVMDKENDEPLDVDDDGEVPQFRRKNLLKDTRYVVAEEAMALFLITLGQNERVRPMREWFQRSSETCSRHFNIVLNAMQEYAKESIVPPSFDETPEYIRTKAKFMPYFKDCIGALDGTHIEAVVPSAQQMVYLSGRKNKPTQNVLAYVILICDLHLFQQDTREQ
ncbi:hypothetical protein QJS10_CPA01g01980 [Acorus calamus]|uniref:DUF8040 domain-containing protein n=1 Tax=Acorus calamus TaxID=4465 RepID=A0AAV9FJZ0_ACOCL|nr:hypothetical protein QJS10_CPA01g01980 [Acorus calamus]